MSIKKLLMSSLLVSTVALSGMSFAQQSSEGFAFEAVTITAPTYFDLDMATTYAVAPSSQLKIRVLK